MQALENYNYLLGSLHTHLEHGAESIWCGGLRARRRLKPYFQAAEDQGPCCQHDTLCRRRYAGQLRCADLDRNKVEDISYLMVEKMKRG